jgi:predicted nuclease of predicted toxin-antitoxin system
MIIYADENIEEAIIQGLRRRGIDVVSARDEGFIGKDDDFHLRQAKRIGAIVLTHDVDFLVLAHRWRTIKREHNGILYAHSQNLPIGECIRRLELVVHVLSEEGMRNHIEFL